MNTTCQKKTKLFSVPQGSIQGAFLFIAYASTIMEVIPNSLQLNAYADDHSIRKSFNPDTTLGPTNNTHTNDETGTIAIIEDTMLKVKTWMDAAHLKLNETKTEFIYFGSRQPLRKCQHKEININGETINRSTKVKYLGGHLDEKLKFNQYVQAKGKVAVINLCKIQNIRIYLTKDACHQLV